MEGRRANLDPRGPAHAVVIYVDRREGEKVPFFKRTTREEAEKQNAKIIEDDPLSYEKKNKEPTKYCLVEEFYPTPLIAVAEGNNYYFYDKKQPNSEKFLADILVKLKQCFDNKYGVEFNAHIMPAPYKRAKDQAKDCAIQGMEMVLSLYKPPGYWRSTFFMADRNKTRIELSDFCHKNMTVHKVRYLSDSSEEDN